MHPKELVTQTFRKRFGKEPAFIAIAPGRVNLLGEHVDYNDGFVLPAAIDRSTYVAFSPAASDRSTLVAADFAEEVSFTPENIPAKVPQRQITLDAFKVYIVGIAVARGDSHKKKQRCSQPE